MSMQVQPAVRQPKALSLEEAERILLVYDYADKEEVEACLAGIKGKQKWLHLIFSETPIPEADMVVQHPAGMKVGVKKPLGEFYDFSLALNSREKISYIWQQIVFYLQSFRTK